jgi:hypothetical protein
VGLGAVELPAGEVVGDPYSARQPIDVHPLQRQQLALAQSGQGRGQVERPLDGAQRIVGDRVYELVELAGLQKADAPVRRVRLLGAIYVRNGVAQNPAALE